MKRVSFGTVVVQRGRRISVGPALLRNLGMKEGDTVEIFLDTEQEAIIIKASNSDFHTTELGSVRSGRKRTQS